MTNVDKVMLKYGKKTQADIDVKEQKLIEKTAKVDAVKADKGKDKTKLTKAALIAKIEELESIIESM